MSHRDQFALLGMRCVQQISLLKLWEQLRYQNLPQITQTR